MAASFGSGFDLAISRYWNVRLASELEEVILIGRAIEIPPSLSSCKREQTPSRQSAKQIEWDGEVDREFCYLPV